ncbi:MAG: hypothetical protein WKF92_12490 [Pyrinomonadaceae bacterium]
MSTFGSKIANDTGDWQNNKEMNPAANSSATEDGLLKDESGNKADSWRDEGESDQSTASGAYKDDTGDPGRTPGKAEGVEDPEEDGNE